MRRTASGRRRTTARSPPGGAKGVSTMRIVIASPPKAGNKWLKCLLASTYDLQVVLGGDTPVATPEALRAWVERGGFRDGWIFHQHAPFSSELCDAIEAIPARLVTIARDPYDQFVSLYHWTQSRAAADRASGKDRPGGVRALARDVLVGKPLDHPDILAYLEREFPDYLVRANEWLHSGRAVVVRYEGLHRDPMGELVRATDQITPVAPDRIQRAVETCRAEHMRRQSKAMARHVRAATVGDWRNHLTEAHLAIFREKHADLVRSLGYGVR